MKFSLVIASVFTIASALKGIPLDGADKICADRKDSTTQQDPAFAIFDTQEFGPKSITSECTQDNECCSSCCDGKKCRAPDALKGEETCRSGLKPDFTNGLKFVGGNGGANNGAKDAGAEDTGAKADGEAGKDGKSDNADATQATAAAEGNQDQGNAGGKAEAEKRLKENQRILAESEQLNEDGTNAGGVADAKKAVDQLQKIVDELNGKKTGDAEAGDAGQDAGGADGGATGDAGKVNRGGTCSKNAEGGDQGGLNGIPVTPDALNCKDRKDSQCNGQGFAAFDDLPFGPKFITSPCTKDEECCTSCCDGQKCRAPDALKGDETCRNGLKPKFDAQGQVSFVKDGADAGAGQEAAASDAGDTGAGKDGKADNSDSTQAAAPAAGGSGKCDAPSILFDVGTDAGGEGFDGREEASFKPSDDSRGSAQRIGIIAEDICNKLKAKCDQSGDTTCECKTKCDAASTAAAGAEGQAAADAFNQALGV